MNVIISEPAVKIFKYNIAVHWLKSQTTSHGDFMYVLPLGLLFANTATIKIVTKHVRCRSFLPHTDLSYKLRD